MTEELWLLLLIGLIFQFTGGVVIAVSPAELWWYVGVFLAILGGWVTLVSLIGFGVMFGLRAHGRQGAS